ncbi:MAG: acetyl-CoA acetyltransferase, partial [Rhodococcus sp. (in: high G+C Gram-positive bacteria)]
MQRAGILAPVQIYPLFENARAHSRGLNPDQGLCESADMYSRFSAIAAEHPVAWSPVARTPEDIGTVSPSNRSVSDCYPLSMNAMPFVDQAAAVMVCSLATARRAGVAEDRMVYLWGGAGAVDSPDVLARAVFDDAPALRAAVQRALSRADVTSANLAFVDAYSCFPIVPALLADELGLAERS